MADQTEAGTPPGAVNPVRTTPRPYGEPSDSRRDARDSVVPEGDLPVPADLTGRGADVWRATVAGMEFRPDEVAVLTELCHTVSELDALRAVLAEQGYTVEGSRGQVRPHPLIAAVQASRALLIRLAQQLALPDPDEETGQSVASKRASHAAKARWQGHVTRADFRQGREADREA